VEEEGKEPGAIKMARLIDYAKHSGIRYVFVQPQFSKKTAKVIAKEIGAQVLIADPLEEDWMENLRNVAAKFRKGLK
jgi:zinc transport system substrate-binding protein